MGIKLDKYTEEIVSRRRLVSKDEESKYVEKKGDSQ